LWLSASLSGASTPETSPSSLGFPLESRSPLTSHPRRPLSSPKQRHRKQPRPRRPLLCQPVLRQPRPCQLLRHQRLPSLEPAMPRPGPRTQKLPPETALPRLRVHSWSRSRHERTPGSPSAPTGGRSCKPPSTHRRKSPLELATGLSLRRGMLALSISHSTGRSCQPRELPTRLRPSLLIPAVRNSSFASAHIADVS